MARARSKLLEPPTTELNYRAHLVFGAMSRGVRVRVWDRGQALEGRITHVERTPQRRDGGAGLAFLLDGRTRIHLDDVTGMERA